MKIEEKKVYDYISELEPYCQLCGSTNLLQRHHIFYRSQGGLTIKENLIVLCDRCHRLVHSNKKYWQDVLIKKQYRRFGRFDKRKCVKHNKWCLNKF